MTHATAANRSFVLPVVVSVPRVTSFGVPVINVRRQRHRGWSKAGNERPGAIIRERVMALFHVRDW